MSVVNYCSGRQILPLLLGMFLTILTVQAQDYPAGFDESFQISTMDPTMASENADAVVRLDEMRFDVVNPGKAALRVRLTVTIFNASGREYGRLPIFYDKLTRLKKLSGRLLDSNGKVIRKLKKEDQEDYVAPTQGSLYEDNRVRIATLYHSAYPYTVEFNYEMSYDGLIHWPSWHPQESGLPVEFSRYEVSVPTGMPVRYQTESTNLSPNMFTRRGRDIYRWEISGQIAGQQRLLATLSPEIALDEGDMVVHLAPAEFEIEGSRGDMRSWQSFGDWYYRLSEGRDVLPQSIRQDVQRLVAGESVVLNRIQKVYEYFQSGTRYVSVQLGLGGWQPFDAQYVAERGYGDCKALTNYLKALLAEAGVTAYPALIRTGRGERDVLPDFPSNQFNHVVLMAPVEGDTLWLEATDQTAPFGHLGGSNEDRYALVVKQGASTLVRTPRTPAQNNRRIREAVVRLEETGYATADVETVYAGNQQDFIRYKLIHASERDRIEWLHNAIDIPAFEILEADFSQLEARRHEVRVPLRLRLPRYASQTGKRLFLPTNLMGRVTYVPPAEAMRTKPVKLGYAYLDQEKLSYTLPAGYTIEAMPADIELETPFSRYVAKHIFDGKDSLRYERTLEFKTRVIDAVLYPEYRAFMAQVVEADRSRVVLVKN